MAGTGRIDYNNVRFDAKLPFPAREHRGSQDGMIRLRLGLILTELADEGVLPRLTVLRVDDYAATAFSFVHHFVEDVGAGLSLLDSRDLVPRKRFPQRFKQIDFSAIAKFCQGFALELALHLFHFPLIAITLPTELSLLFQEGLVAVPGEDRPLLL